MPPKYLNPHNNNHNKHAHPKRPYRSEPARSFIPSSAFIQAYEAQLVYGQPALAEEVISRDGRRGVGLIKYAGEVEEDVGGIGRGEIWADRHDVLHLVPSLPSSSSSRLSAKAPSPTPSSSSSWFDLPSDLEETFDISDAEELEKYEAQKKKKWIEALREARLKEREREDGEVTGTSVRREGDWDPNEEPTPQILQLITHTAHAILSSPNPSVLELRILTNHATDERFSFLRGRYKSAWERAKADFRKNMEEKRIAKEREKGLGVLGGYGSDSDEEEGTPGSPEGDTPPPPPADEDQLPPPPPPPPDLPSAGREEGDTLSPRFVTQAIENKMINGDGKTIDVDEEDKKRLRRLRAEEWKRKRAAAKE
ncbi:hypothetical protein IAR55_001532 [Kwoniella newhampshirensis]|uniref:SURP motif domain-containing protein n=1 Tax=Kwoniella newhampshirensis TaxID=1651941 RepID=A0AAW0Z2F1_9TREE